MDACGALGLSSRLLALDVVRLDLAVRIAAWPLDAVARALSVGVEMDLLDLPSVGPAVLPLGKDRVPDLRTTPRGSFSPTSGL